MSLKLSILVFLLFVSSFSTFATTYFVKETGDDLNTGLSWNQAFATIAKAVSMSVNGDDILIGYDSDGTTYSITSALLLEKNLRITSAREGTDNSFDTAVYDSSKCIIDANSLCRIFTIADVSITNATRIRGLGIYRGSANGETSNGIRKGGGIYIYGCYPIIENCDINNNIGSNESTVLADNIGVGGGIAILNTGSTNKPIIQYCKIHLNKADSRRNNGYGGGIFIGSSSSPVIQHNMISQNIGSSGRFGYGGGICISGFAFNGHINAPTILYNDISYNSASISTYGEHAGSGGGIYSYGDAGIVFSYNLIRNNTAYNNTLATCSGSGGGANFNSPNTLAVVSNNTFNSNANGVVAGVLGKGSGLYISLTTTTYGTFKNNIFSNHNVANSDGRAFYLSGSDPMTITYNCFFNNTINVSSSSGIVTSNNEVLSNPVFVDASNFNLQSTSPCIDAGDPNSTVPEGGEPIVDIGAFEYISESQNTTNNLDNTLEGNFLFGQGLSVAAHVGPINATVQQFLGNPPNNPGGLPTIGKYWDISATGNAYLRLYYPASATAGFTTTRIFHYSGSEWQELVTTAEQTAGTSKYVETTNPVTSFSYFTVGDAAAPLPVELISFTAVKAVTGVLLKWVTASEIKNYGFEVERNIPNSACWEMIGFVKGNGSCNSQKEYSFMDKPVTNGKYRYRLKQIDTDGKYEYSPEIEATIDIPAEFTVKQNYPNPFNPVTSIEFSLPEDNNVEIAIYNTIGMEVMLLLNEKKQAGTHSIEFNASNFASGIYYYKVVSGNYTAIKKMVLLR
ncbi:MAG: T9SS type A sorting domain-containing protein [Ignavibacteriaceae bacterium]